MKNKLIIIFLILSIIFVGCGKKNKEDITEPTNDTATTTESQNDDIKIYDISIFTKDAEIPYERFIKNDDENSEEYKKYNNTVNDFIEDLKEDKLTYLEKDTDIRIDIEDLKEDKLTYLEKDTDIRIDFNNIDVKKIKNIDFNKTYVTKDKDYHFKIDSKKLTIDENGFINIKYSYDDKDENLKGILYEIMLELENETYKYVFSFKIDNKIEEDSSTYSLTGYLSQDEQKIYDSYKKDKDIKRLANNTPIMVLKLYTQAILDKEYSLAYSLYQDYNNTTEENYIKIMESFSKETKEDYISNLKAAADGKFIEDTKENGYIEYEIVKDHPRAIDMIKDSNR